MSKKSSKQKKTNGKRRKKRSTPWVIAILLVVVVLSVACFFIFKEDKDSTIPDASEKSSEPQFKKDGELIFIKQENNEQIIKIDIEIADTDLEKTQGLMYRSSLPDSAGMLFTFRDSRPRSFWMKNTSIPLDILYINENKEIVTIHRYTTPYSEKSIPSYKDAMYVLEVNEGFCDKHDIHEGARIQF